MNFLSCTIWLVGVEDAEQDHLSVLLTQRGFSVRTLADGKSAFQAFDTTLPDLLVVSACLPDMPATQLCQRLRLNAATRGIPVVVLTEQTDSAVEREVLERGADACFSAKGDPVFLMFRICALLREHDDDVPVRDTVSFRQPSVVVVTAPGGLLWAWQGPGENGQPKVIDLLHRNGESVTLIEDPDRLDFSGHVAGQVHPDCVVIDLCCPLFDGLALARTLVAMRRRNRQCTRVLAMTESGQVSGQLATVVFGAGVDDLVDADITPDLLLARIGSLVRRKILQDEMRREEAHIESARARMALADALRRVNADLAAANRKLIEAQAKLVQSAKMASLGELAAGIAHEFNNPLAFVLAHEGTVNRTITRAMQAVRDGDMQTAETALAKSGERLAASFVGLSRMRDLVTSLRRFSRLEEGEFTRLDVPEALAMVLTLLAPKLGQEIRVISALEAPPELFCQAALVNQVVMNIVSNAADAILEKRREKKEQGKIKVEEDIIEITSRLEPGAREDGGQDYVIRISDTGPGVPKNLQERIFEPFFTTKPVGSGTGLGLATAYGVVQAHGGSIVVTDARENAGACFTLRVPYRAAEERRSEHTA
ncbi:MAG: ATP-binding protein [Acetobacter indonesiensis]|jgi:two-component system NtrC family sensor kinase|nr:ATP-binding protein [Acetobacter indonesiensis]MCI1545204.1 ATP-binding protein [Acetobacter indonesiensis]MCI1764552.1 ATP-binding protein [Acetobacter indonesiensis]